MTEFEWHKPTKAEVEGRGYDLILDVSQDTVPHRAAEHEGMLIRITKPGWSWWARSISATSFGDTGTAETREQAIADGLEALGRIRAEQPLPRKRRTR